MLLFTVVLIALFGALVRTVFGFGEALVSMPLLALVGYNLQSSTALIGALGLLVALPATIKYRAHIDKKIIIRLVTGSLFGIPLGIWLIKNVDAQLVLHLLGTFLIIYGTYSLLKNIFKKSNSQLLHSNLWDFIAGFISGTLGSAYNSHGVPIAIYGTLRNWNPDKLRGILQAHFLCVGLLVVISQISAGFWSIEVVKLLLFIIPGLFIVIPVGNWIFKKISPEHLINLIYFMLIIFGILLWFK